MFQHTYDNYPVLAHSFIAVHVDRTREFVQQYKRLANALNFPLDHRLAARVQTEILTSICQWEQANYQIEINDMHRVVESERDATLLALHCSLQHVNELSEDEERPLVEQILAQWAEALAPLPRTASRSLRHRVRCILELKNLDAPGIVLAHEGRRLAAILENWKSPPQAWDDSSEWQVGGYRRLLRAGLRACAIIDSSGNRNRDIGLGISHAAGRLLRVSDANYDSLLDDDDEEGERPVELTLAAAATFPLVPMGRLHGLGPSFEAVRDHGHGTGPFGWAEGQAVADLADAFGRLNEPTHARDIARVTTSLQKLHADGHAVMGCLEFLTYESDGVRLWLVNRDDDSAGLIRVSQ